MFFGFGYEMPDPPIGIDIPMPPQPIGSTLLPTQPIRPNEAYPPNPLHNTVIPLPRCEYFLAWFFYIDKKPVLYYICPTYKGINSF